MFEQTFKNIDDILHKDAGCGSELDYVEQTSWVLFLKYLDDLDRDKATSAELTGRTHTAIIAPEFQWTTWAAPKLADGRIDHNALTGDDLIDFVNGELFPYLKKFKTSADNANIIEYLSSLFGELPKLFKSEDELRSLWSNPTTRNALLAQLDEAGFSRDDLKTLQQLINAEKSDLYDVLEYVFNSDITPITREERVAKAGGAIFATLGDQQKEFIEFVLSKYVEEGVEELSQDKLPYLLTNKYHSLEDAKEVLGDPAAITALFINFQKYLYLSEVA